MGQGADRRGGAGHVELVYRWVSAIFEAAVGDRLMASSPCIRIALPKRNDAEAVPLTVTEVEALAAAVPDRYRATSTPRWSSPRGSSVKTVQRRLGHQSAMETLDTYGHLWPDSEDETRHAVDGVLAGVTGQGSSRQAALAASAQ